MTQIEKGKKENNKVEITVTVEIEKVQHEFNNTYRELSQKVKIPGFRTGRIPINILEMNLGKEYIDQQVAEKLIKDSYNEAIDKSELDPIDVPKIDLVQTDKEKPFIYKMILEVKPEFEIPKLDDITVEKTIPKITEEDINSDLEKIRESHGKLKDVSDRESKIGDFLIADFETFVDNNPVKDGKKEKQMIQLGENTPPEFNNNLVGLKPGDEKDVVVKAPEDISDKKIAGKEITYKIKVSDIKEKELPPLDDDFAKSAGEYKNLDELKQHIKKQLEERAKYQAENEFNDNLMEKVAEKTNIEVPEVLIDKQVERMLNNLKEDLKNRNMTLEDYYKIIKADEEKVKKEYKVIAEKQVKKELIIDKIIEDDKISATEEDINKKIEEIAESTNQKTLKVRAMFEKNNTMDNLKEQIKIEKVIEKLSMQVKIEEK
ncbi:MAG: trigger factor [Candidatus Caldatribacteriota bacterium]|nr:trigger factor [Atribacterota bacterium]MDD4288738.1 trigger factor [Atribacterota bacterium]MDD5635851.1 trigger factor [Atribacterota bacterium]